MVQGLKKIFTTRRELIIVGVIAVLFLVLAYKYLISTVIDRVDIKDTVSRSFHSVSSIIEKNARIDCRNDHVKITLSDGELCREVVTDPDLKTESYITIYDTYPKYAGERDNIYGFLDTGSIEAAQSLQSGVVPIERYEPVEITAFSWEEDPYGERYWRFIYYSLRETRHLLHAFKETGDHKYRDTLIETVDSFLTDGMNKEFAWDDYHAVAFRTMTLINIWWDLREMNELPIDTSNKILAALERHGEFLMDPAHYEPTYNHGVTQAAALLNLAVAFPDLKNADAWLANSIARIDEGAQTLVDEDGILVENSPFYHFYTLEKFWEIQQYISSNNITLNSNLPQVISNMLSYGTHILQPNLTVPTMGASLARTLGYDGVYKEMAYQDEEFRYVLTQGSLGEEPEKLNTFYPTGGRAILRSGWDKKTKLANEFVEQTHIVFDVGPYRTDHSDYDALNFTLYSNGKTLIPDSGLYTYEKSDPLKAYFHGTRGHNTVVVDGNDQLTGSATHVSYQDTKDYSMVTAQHDLYPTVTHQRSLLHLDKNLVLIVDRLISDREHTYEQIFHTFPGSHIETHDDTTVVYSETDKREFTIHQLIPTHAPQVVVGDTTTGKGNCSLEYEKLVPCPELSYTLNGTTVTYATLLSIGDAEDKLQINIESADIVQISHGMQAYHVSIGQADESFTDESRAQDVLLESYRLELLKVDDTWTLTGDSSELFSLSDEGGSLAVITSTGTITPARYAEQPFYTLEVPNIESYYSKGDTIQTDLPAKPSIRSFTIFEQEDFLPILGYHNIIPDSQEIEYPTLEMHISDFDDQIRYLTIEEGCRWFTFGDIMSNYVLRNKKTPKNACVINFDDGRKNHFTNGYPVLSKYRAVASYYVITGRLKNDSSNYMSVENLTELYRNGSEIGSHTFTSSTLLDESYTTEDIIYQLSISRHALENYGFDALTFAYPRGEQNSEVVSLTSKFYLAGRDTSKDNVWRERRSATISFDPDYIWHMHYHKPELETPEELTVSIGYNTWWQFEEGYRVDRDYNNNIKTLSSVKPTHNSFASVSLPDPGDAISNPFITSVDAEYTAEMYVHISDFLPVHNSLRVLVDNEQMTLKRGTCDTSQSYEFCLVTFSTNLTEGAHTLTVQSLVSEIIIDKFRWYRTFVTQDSYPIIIQKLKRIPPREHVYPLEVRVEKKSRVEIPLTILITLTLVNFNLYLLIKIRRVRSLRGRYTE